MGNLQRDQEVIEKLLVLYSDIIRINKGTDVYLKGLTAIGYIVYIYYDLGVVKIHLPGGELSLMFTKVAGRLHINPDKILSDDICMDYYKHNVEIYNKMGEGQFIERDKVSIMRRHTLKNIIKD